VLTNHSNSTSALLQPRPRPAWPLVVFSLRIFCWKVVINIYFLIYLVVKMYQNHQIYSVTELEELSNKHQSFVVLKKSVIKVLLAPAYIGNVKKGIFNALVKKLRVYDNT